MKKIWKKIKDWFIRVINRIKYKINKKSLPKKVRKDIKMEKEIASHYSRWGNFLRLITGCTYNNLKITEA